ncbi:MAG: Ku protein [Smithellaceae bacterium]
MAEQGIWSGTISFSLVAIPVHLVKAVEPGRVSFHLLHKKDYSPLARRMYCPQEERIVAADEIIRGYEISPDKYITITDEELESVAPERSRTIEIAEFFDRKEFNLLYYNHPYYLVPAKGGEKAYQLLAEIMHRTDKAGIAKFILGEREHLVAIYSNQGVLSLITLHYADEIVSADNILPEMPPDDALQTSKIKNIIKGMIADFNPDKHADQHRKKIMAILTKKKKKQPPVWPPVIEEEAEGPADLIAVLEESMRKVKQSR